MQAAGEDGVDDLHHNTHDVNEVGGLGAQSLFVNDAVCILIVYRPLSRRLDRCDRMIQNEGNDSRKLFTLKIALCR